MFDLGCSCDAVGEGLPRRYLARISAHSSRVFSCQLSNRINKKVEAPRRGCTYGPKAYADCHEDCRNTRLNIQRGLRKVNANKQWDHENSLEHEQMFFFCDIIAKGMYINPTFNIN